MEALKNIASITTMVYFFMLRKYIEFSKPREEIPRFINRKKFYLALLMMHVFSITSAVSNSLMLWTAVHQATLSMGFSRQEYWSGLICPHPGNLPNSGIQSVSLESPA